MQYRALTYVNHFAISCKVYLVAYHFLLLPSVHILKQNTTMHKKPLQ